MDSAVLRIINGMASGFMNSDGSVQDQGTLQSLERRAARTRHAQPSRAIVGKSSFVALYPSRPFASRPWIILQPKAVPSAHGWTMVESIPTPRSSYVAVWDIASRASSDPAWGPTKEKTQRPKPLDVPVMNTLRGSFMARSPNRVGGSDRSKALEAEGCASCRSAEGGAASVDSEDLTGDPGRVWGQQEGGERGNVLGGAESLHRMLLGNSLRDCVIGEKAGGEAAAGGFCGGRVRHPGHLGG